MIFFEKKPFLSCLLAVFSFGIVFAGVHTKPLKQRIKHYAKKKNMRNNNGLIREVAFDAFDNEGYPLAHDIARIINHLFRTPVWSGSLLKQSQIKRGFDLVVEECCLKGSYTGKIFIAKRVDTKQAIFFLKISTENAANAWKNLYKIQNGSVGRFGLQSMCDVNLPIITNVEMFLKYMDPYGDEKIIEVMHIAGGEVLCKIFADRKNPDVLLECAEKVGVALGRFHQAFMYHNDLSCPQAWITIIHGDFHFGNIFFKKSSGYSRVYFIDNETIAKSLTKKQPIDWDIIFFIFQPVLMWEMIRECSDVSWISLVHFYKFFFNGYIQSYPKQMRKALAPYIGKIIFDRISLAQEYIKNLCSRVSLLENLSTIQNPKSEIFLGNENNLFGVFCSKFRMFENAGERDIINARLEALKLALADVYAL